MSLELLTNLSSVLSNVSSMTVVKLIDCLLDFNFIHNDQIFVLILVLKSIRIHSNIT